MFLADNLAGFLDKDSVLGETMLKGGPFVLGCICGGFFSDRFYARASKERIERDKHDAARQQELLQQLKVKDERIDALHEKLAKREKKLSGTPELPFTSPQK